VDHDISPREAARMARRDRDLSAQERALMRTGLAKGFQQIANSVGNRAAAASLPRKAGKARRKGRAA
jgi:hypothetical protein